MNELTKKYGLNIINCAAAVKQAQKAGQYVNVMRPSKWGNPFVIGRDGTRTEVLEKYRKHLLAQPELVAALPELKGKMLGCVCLPMPCHVEILIELANLPQDEVVKDEVVEEIDIDFRKAVELICRCGKSVSVGHAGPGNIPVAFHKMPFCAEFERYDLIDYLRWVRGATEN